MAASMSLKRTNLILWMQLFKRSLRQITSFEAVPVRCYSAKNLDGKHVNVLIDADDLFNSSKKTENQQRSPKAKSGVKNNIAGKPQPFQKIVQQRHREALRSVIVRSPNPENTLPRLRQYGRLLSAHITSEDKMFLIAQYSDHQSVERLLHNTQPFSFVSQFPLKSRLLYDSSVRTNDSSRKRTRLAGTNLEQWQERASAYSSNQDTLEGELLALLEQKSLNDLDLRLRFFVCVLLEDLLQACLPGCRIIPYGSCLNGFGWWNSDLDMMLCMNDPYSPSINSTVQNGRYSNFRFLTEMFDTERQLAQRTLAMIAQLLELMPRISSIQKILNARVPIIRFKHLVMNLHCDISLQAVDSLKMTELLYLLSVVDWRVKPLMTCIKQWAVAHHLTSSGEQQKPTTIGLLSMLIFYLQTRSPPVLPTLKDLRELAGPRDKFEIDGVMYGFPSDPSRLLPSKNSESIDDLLHGFFLFYSEFDFDTQAISLIEGCTFNKPNKSSSVYVENPLKIGLNICMNVGPGQLLKFTCAMKDAVHCIDEFTSKCVLGESRLARLFDSFSHEEHVSVQVEDLFGDDGENSNETEKGDEELDEVAEIIGGDASEKIHTGSPSVLDMAVPTNNSPGKANRGMNQKT